MHTFFYFGRSERIVASLLILIALSALALYIWASPKPKEPRSAESHMTKASQSDTIYKDKHYVGPPSHLRAGKSNKFAQRTILDLNSVDSSTLVRVPGIGPTFARRIIELRNRLGGYYTTMQLQEVYGLDEDKYLALRPWFAIRTAPQRYPLDELRSGEIPKHIYLSWEQQKALNKLINRHGKISSWQMLMRETCFTREDSIRLSPYFPSPTPKGKDSTLTH